jgi:hypothetical protein
MLRAFKTVDWSARLPPEDCALIGARIEPETWYPMESFERMGNAILAQVGNNDLQSVRMWGRLQVGALREQNPALVQPGDAVETLMRFRVLRGTYFDFPALDVPTLIENHADIEIRYHMGATAEEAASYQTMGFFEGLLEAAGASDVYARFEQRAWTGDPRTLLVIDWH